MVILNIVLKNKKISKVVENEIDSFEIDRFAINVEIMLSGLYLTENEDYSFDSGTITFFETVLENENLNIKYQV